MEIREKFTIDFINVEKRSKFHKANKNANYPENGNNKTIRNHNNINQLNSVLMVKILVKSKSMKDTYYTQN